MYDLLKRFRFASIILLILVTGCYSTGFSGKPITDPMTPTERNANILAASFMQPTIVDREYRLGATDVLDIKILGANELNRKVRISGDGTISFPLIGVVNLQGQTLSQAQTMIERRLGESYLQNPQVSIYSDEYGSNQVMVLGQVTKQNVYSLKQPRTIVETLALAGGLTNSAGLTALINTTQFNSQTGVSNQLTLSVEIEELFSGSTPLSSMTLGSGDRIYVPEAGEVYIEGAVEEPGAFAIQGELSLRKALIKAGGVKWTAKKSNIGILKIGYDQPRVVNYNHIINNPDQDILIEAGDVIIVDYSLPKSIAGGFINFASRIINVGVGYRVE